MALLALALVAALPAPAPAVAPPKRRAPEPPAFLQLEPWVTAAGVLGMGQPPQVGRLTALANVAAGQDPRMRAWNLEGPFFSRHNRRVFGASTLFLGGFYAAAGAPTAGVLLPTLATLAAGDYANCWRLLDTDVVRRIPRRVLKVVRDGRGIANGSLEVDAYVEFLVRAHYTSAKAFARAASRDITYAHLFNEPARYRGRVVHFQGRLKRINRYDPPPEAAAEGVSNLYEAWLFNEHFGPHPFVVVFTEWPAKLPIDLLGEPKIDRVVEVSFDGYFYKKFRYKAIDSKANTRRDAPLLIGHTLTVKRVPPAAGESNEWANTLLYVFLGLLAAVVFLVVGLTYWFRRTDSRVRDRLLASRGEFVMPPPDALPVNAPDVPSGKSAGGARLVAPLAGRAVPAAQAGDRGGERPGQPPRAGGTSEKGAQAPGPDEGAGS
jgi:hypothetical protein